jgi:hypothetical protein
MDAPDFAWMLEAIAESLDDCRRHPQPVVAQRDRELTIGLEPDVEAQGAADGRETDGVRQRVEQNEPDLQLVGEEARAIRRDGGAHREPAFGTGGAVDDDQIRRDGIGQLEAVLAVFREPYLVTRFLETVPIRVR